MSFFDRYGNIKPNSWDEQSENPTTFNACYYFSSFLFHKPSAGVVKVMAALKTKYTTNGNTWRTMEYDMNPRWSIDEKVSACALMSVNDVYDLMKTIPFTGHSISHLRPDVLAYVLGSKTSWLRFFLWPVVWIKISISMMEFKKNPQGESSGVQLGFIMAMGWSKHHWVYDHLEQIGQAMNIYYPEEQHPTRRLWND